MLAKAKLFERSEVAIINRDDDSYKFMITRLKNKKVVSYGLSANADSNLTNHSFKTLLPGKFNQLNILAALTVADILEIDSQKAANAVSSAGASVKTTDQSSSRSPAAHVAAAIQTAASAPAAIPASVSGARSYLQVYKRVEQVLRDAGGPRLPGLSGQRGDRGQAPCGPAG